MGSSASAGARLWALAAGPSALAWAWPADGAVLREFSVVADKYAAGQHRGIDIGGRARGCDTRSGRRRGDVRRPGADARPHRDDRDRRAQGVAHPPRRTSRQARRPRRAKAIRSPLPGLPAIPSTTCRTSIWGFGSATTRRTWTRSACFRRGVHPALRRHPRRRPHPLHSRSPRQHRRRRAAVRSTVATRTGSGCGPARSDSGSRDSANPCPRCRRREDASDPGASPRDLPRDASTHARRGLASIDAELGYQTEVWPDGARPCAYQSPLRAPGRGAAPRTSPVPREAVDGSHAVRRPRGAAEEPDSAHDPIGWQPTSGRFSAAPPLHVDPRGDRRSSQPSVRSRRSPRRCFWRVSRSAPAGLGARRVARRRLLIIGARERAGEAEEDPGRGGVAVCERAAAHRPCRGLRRPVGHVRPLSPASRERRAHGQRDRRARHAGHGRGRRRRRVAA